MQLTFLLTILTTTVTVRHCSCEHRLHIYFYWQYHPPQSLILAVLLLTILSTTTTVTAFADAAYISTDNTDHYSHCSCEHRLHIYFYWQYCPPQSLVLAVLLLTTLSTTATGTAFADAAYICTDNTDHHSHWACEHRLHIYFYWQYCPLQSLVLVVLLLTILSTTAAGTAWADVAYISADNTDHDSHWPCLYRLHIHFYWQYCPPQSLVLAVLLLTILSTTPTGTTCADAAYISTDNTDNHSQWSCQHILHIHFYWQYCPPQSLVLVVLLLTILSTTPTGTACADATYISIDNTDNHSHWSYPYRLHIHFFWQYHPPQSLVLVVLLLTILSTTPTGTACADATYISTDNTDHDSHWSYPYRLHIHFFWQYHPPQSLVLVVLLLTILPLQPLLLHVLM